MPIFIFAKIGSEDAFEFPSMPPGTVVRVDTRAPDRFLPNKPGDASRVFFLVEHSEGLACCRVRRVDTERIALHTTELAYAQVPLRLGHECVLRGIVDLEIRTPSLVHAPKVPRELMRFRPAQPLPPAEHAFRLGQRIRMARLRSGLHFREAASRSAIIARFLQDSRYLISAASLSDYEKTNSPSRDIHKILSLCMLYALDLRTFLNWIGYRPDHSPEEAIPDQYLPNREWTNMARPRERTAMTPGNRGVLKDILSRIEEVPYFMADSLSELTGLTSPSMRDIFWVARERLSYHPYLQGAVLLAVNRRMKRLPNLPSGPIVNQPLFVLSMRGGSYLCGRCTLEADYIVLHPFANGFSEPKRFRNRVEAEILGKVVTIVRRFRSGA